MSEKEKSASSPPRWVYPLVGMGFAALAFHGIERDIWMLVGLFAFFFAAKSR